MRIDLRVMLVMWVIAEIIHTIQNSVFVIVIVVVVVIVENRI